MQLKPEDIMQLKQAGYSDQDILEAYNEVKQEMQQEGVSPLEQSYQQTVMSKQMDPRQFSSPSAFSSIQYDNMIKWQLELDSLLERIEHLLRGDKITFKEGHVIWIPATKESDVILNEFGVAEVMRILSMYLNRNTILSNYDEETINWKVYDFGNEISDLFFLKYEAMGLDTLEKRKRYPMLVRELVDAVHSSYLRALHGGERMSLREARQVTQQEQLAGRGTTINLGQSQMKERSILNPFRYVKGKYY